MERTMSSSEPIAYTYEADTHCPYHARLRFGRDARGIIGGESVDSEGNAVGAVFEWDDWGSAGLYCGDDLETIRAPYVEPDEGELAAFTLTDAETIARVCPFPGSGPESCDDPRSTHWSGSQSCH